VIGDSCLDKFIYGTCDRLSPEAPVPVLKHVVTKTMPGMAGNVAENAKAFSKNVTLVSQQSKIEKIRYVDSKSNQHIMRFDIEPNENRDSDIFFTNGMYATRAISEDYDVVILSDYNKGFLMRRQILSFTQKMKQPIYVDSKRSNLQCFKNSIIKLNEKEFYTSSKSVDETSDIIETLGCNGARYKNIVYPSKTVEVFDVSGAGDTFLSSFSIYHHVTNNIGESILFANKCSSIVVQKKGTYSLKNCELL